MPIHSILIRLAREYSPDVFSDKHEGLCLGFTTRWMEACLLNEYGIFVKRIDYIVANEQKLLTMLKSGIYPMDPDQQDFLAFFESMMIFQKTSQYACLEPGVHQFQIENSSIIASSDKILQLGGLVQLSSDLRIFSHNELSTYLMDLADLIEHAKHKIPDPVIFFISMGVHQIGLSYQTGVGWNYMDVNEFPAVELPRPFENLIPKQIFSIYSRSFEFMTINIECFSLKYYSHNSHLQDLLQKFALSYYITPEIANRRGYLTLLYHAVLLGKLDLVKVLIKNGSKLITPEGEYSAFSVALVRGYNDIFELLINECTQSDSTSNINELNLSKNFSSLLFRRACSEGNLTIVQYLAAKEPDVLNNEVNQISPLQIACNNGHLDIVNFLLEKRIIGIERDSLEIALIHACRFGNEKIVAALIEAGANLEYVSMYGFSPLFEACSNGHLHVVKLLLDHGVPPFKKAHWHQSAIREASINGHIEIVQLLSKSIAQFDCSTNRIPLDCINPLANDVINALESFRRSVKHHPEEMNIFLHGCLGICNQQFKNELQVDYNLRVCTEISELAKNIFKQRNSYVLRVLLDILFIPLGLATLGAAFGIKHLLTDSPTFFVGQNKTRSQNKLDDCLKRIHSSV